MRLPFIKKKFVCEYAYAISRIVLFHTFYDTILALVILYFPIFVKII